MEKAEILLSAKSGTFPADARQLFNQLRAGKSGTTEKSTGTVKIYHIFYKRTKNKLYI